jgi:hypothetical protein
VRIAGDFLWQNLEASVAWRSPEPFPEEASKMDIQPGTRVLVRTAFDDLVERRALTGIEPGIDFPVVWVCTEEEWMEGQRAGSQVEGDPWPAEDVSLAEKVPA